MLRDVPSVSVEPAQPGRPGRVTGAGRMIDRFGNILSDIPRSAVDHVFGSAPCRVSVGGMDAGPLRRTYADGAPGQIIAILNGWDLVEAAVREGRAAECFPGLDPSQIGFELRAN
jgi:S-adenosylmethionine hydrolase